MTISTLTYQIKASSSIIPESPKKYLKHKNPKLLKRIPLEKLMDLKVDYAFKQLFGNEKNKEITKLFLHACDPAKKWKGPDYRPVFSKHRNWRGIC
ncbi:hypothetical protein P5G51_001410 [Virgibacillus sp. 179-BFC.A HS]|uniref:Transposase n=1 Tax=Tigheibacillus jepli TaxID=3035914 RepID=A0ABU5CEG5_9BACI|nr:hypothetical protein [Virgibacillus sp. 179-BFC.A HS]MDY0404247.1 hypothetical protein [Virgibacillus sp. 179-BFC.A HS]